MLNTGKVVTCSISHGACNCESSRFLSTFSAEKYQTLWFLRLFFSNVDSKLSYSVV